MKLHKDYTTLQHFPTATQYEWLETNGLGGYAGSSIVFANTRRYHGLLVAATVPPAERMVLVSKLDETIITGNTRTELGCNLYRDNTVHPSGYQYLESFHKEMFPRWIYKADGVMLQKTVAMVHEQNTTLIRYDVLHADEPFTLELQPFLAGRDYHALMHANDSVQQTFQFDNDVLQTRLYDGAPGIFIQIPGSEFHAQPCWYFHFNYAVEQYRGQDFEEDLFTPGHFSMQLQNGNSVYIVLSTERPGEQTAQELFDRERIRREQLLQGQPQDETLQQLIWAADQFIVKRGDNLKSIIAGYHWFADWGRDTMISLPGLCLATGRYEDARKILSAFASVVDRGMLPNRFQDNGQEPEYNNVDGTLWYFIAIYQYLVHTGDEAFVLQELLPVLKNIIDEHFKGARYNIHVDEDGLLYAGEKGQQLTWMDARVDGWVVTPRMGKPVEVQALWYNALNIFAELLTLNGQQDDAVQVLISAARVKESFLEKFRNTDGGYLYDVIDEHGNPDATLRPNQLFAISLPFALVEGKLAQQVLEIVERKLCTPVGLRSLPADHPGYTAYYGGDRWQRDGAYHQGTVWSWLIGPYIDTLMKVRNGEREYQARLVAQQFLQHLQEGCIGSVSEIFDANTPHHPRGCVAQAWGVAEILRVIKAYGLYEPLPAAIKVNVATPVNIEH